MQRSSAAPQRYKVTIMVGEHETIVQIEWFYNQPSPEDCRALRAKYGTWATITCFDAQEKKGWILSDITWKEI